MRKRTVTIVLIGFLIFLGLSIRHYLKNGYEIEYREKDNIVATDEVRQDDEILLPVSYLEYDKGKTYWGFIDLNGDVAISLTYDSVSLFDDNYLAVVELDELFGLVDTNNRKILNIEYQKIQYMGEGIYYFEDKQKGYLGKYEVSSNPKINVMKEVSYDEVGMFSESLAYVVKNNKLGYIDKNGNEKIGLNFDFVQDFNFNFYDGYAFVYKDNQYGIIKSDGNYQLTPELDEVMNTYTLKLDFKEIKYENYEMIPYRKGDKWGYINNDGTVLISPRYIEAYPFTGDNLARVRIDSSGFNYINTNGSQLLDINYIKARDFYNGYAAVGTNFSAGLIDSSGKKIIELENDYVGSVNNNRVVIYNKSISKYVNVNNIEDSFIINYYIGDDVTDCGVIFASDEVGENRDYVILNYGGERILSDITSNYYKQINYRGHTLVVLIAYEEKYNFEYYTYLDQAGNLLWKVYK